MNHSYTYYVAQYRCSGDYGWSKLSDSMMLSESAALKICEERRDSLKDSKYIFQIVKVTTIEEVIPVPSSAEKKEGS